MSPRRHDHRASETPAQPWTFGAFLGLVIHLNRALCPPDCDSAHVHTWCDGTHARTRAWLEAHGLDVDRCMSWLRVHGACCCDCEVLLDVVGRPLDCDAGATLVHHRDATNLDHEGRLACAANSEVARTAVRRGALRP